MVTDPKSLNKLAGGVDCLLYCVCCTVEPEMMVVDGQEGSLGTVSDVWLDC
jgi:hypothetical protein